MNCPDCQSQEVVKNGRTKRQDGSVVQKYLCKVCNKQFNERSGTPMARLRTGSVIVCAALNVRTEGLGIRATGRSRAQVALDDYALLKNDWPSRKLTGLPLPLSELMLRSKAMNCTLVRL
jgi:DNA-directed RNA polymerase subunit RPC12/RpoP